MCKITKEGRIRIKYRRVSLRLGLIEKIKENRLRFGLGIMWKELSWKVMWKKNGRKKRLDGIEYDMRVADDCE